MATLTLERRFDAPPDRVFAFVSQTEHLLKWWGHDDMTIPEHNLALDRKGPWYSVLMGAQGQRYKVSGHVTHVDPPNSIGFTWAWHDENDRRGVESHVTIRLVPASGGGTDFTLNHVDLPDDGVADNHRKGWTLSLLRLERVANA